MGTFEQARREEAEAIPWIGGPRGAQEQATLGRAQDDEITLLKEAVRMQAGPFTCPDDALDIIGKDFGIPRFPGEADGTAPTDATDPSTGSGYRGRLCNAWATWELAGTKAAIIASLHAFGFDDASVSIYEFFEWPTPDGWWSKFYVVLRSGGFFSVSPLLWGSFQWGEVTWGTTATTADIRQIVGQILKWKSAHSLPVKVVLWFDGEIWGPMVWGDSVWGGTSAAWRLANLWGNTIWGGFNWGNGTWT